LILKKKEQSSQQSLIVKEHLPRDGSYALFSGAIITIADFSFLFAGPYPYLGDLFFGYMWQ
jgi:hypothetical protein